jgi:hypothetical protein
MAEIGDVVRREDGCWGVVVAKKKGRRAVRWEPLWRGSVSVHEPEELEVMRRLNKPARRAAPKKILGPDEEPVFFATWLDYHSERSRGIGLDAPVRTVPRAGTMTRSDLARMFDKLLRQGFVLDDFKAATDGVFASEWHVANGHTKFATVLREGSFSEKVDEGRAWRAAQENDKYARFG